MKPLKLSTILWLAGTICTLLFGGCLWLWNESTKADLAAAQERCRAAGLPMTIDAICPPPVPDADNAALVIEKLKPLLERLTDSTGENLFARLAEWDLEQPPYRLDAKGATELAAMLDTQPVREAIALIHEVTLKSGYNAQIDYNKIKSRTLPPSEEPIMQSARLLNWRAQLAASRKESIVACETVWMMMRLGDLTENEPLLSSQFMRWNIWHWTVDRLEQLNYFGCISPDWNRKFSRRLADQKFTKSLVRCFDGDRLVFGAEYFRLFIEEKMGLNFRDTLCDMSRLERLSIERYRLPGMIRLEYAQSLDRIRAIRDLAATVTLSSTNYDSIWRAIGFPSFNQPLQMLLVLPLGGSTILDVRNLQAKIAMAQVGLALEKYRDSKGDYPATLAALVPDFISEVPSGIFTDKPLIYRPEPGGAVVYSVGPNLTDDGGVFDWETDKDDPNWASGTAAARKFAPPAPATPPPATDTPPLPTTATPPPSTSETAPVVP